MNCQKHGFSPTPAGSRFRQSLSAAVLNAWVRHGLVGLGLVFLLAGHVLAAPEDDFVTTWQTDNPGSSSPTSITIPMVGGPYDVDWNNNGTFDQTGLNGPVTHDYGEAGTYTVRIRGSYGSIWFANTGDGAKILSVDQWGTGSWQSMVSAFFGAENLQIPAVDTPDFSAVTNMSQMFLNATVANPDTSGWDTSAVTSMHGMFSGATSANPDTSGWDTSAVTNMHGMFSGATSANPDTSGWNTGAVTTMRVMFFGATAANPDTSGWDTSAVTDMAGMFNLATSANPDTRGWETGAVTTMRAMFLATENANPDTSGWETGAVTDMAGMFSRATSANPDTSGWETGAVTTMRAMFQATENANPDTSGWETGAVTDMSGMFNLATSVNPDTAGWETGAVIDMERMFRGAILANPDTSAWNTGAVTNMSWMFRDAISANPSTSDWVTGAVAVMDFMFSGAISANPDASGWNVQSLSDATSMFDSSGLITTNYEALLEAWGSQIVLEGVPFGAASNHYCSQSTEIARANLIADDLWSITDLGRGCSVGGEIDGLQGSGPTLQLNGGNDLPVTGNGAFAFPGSLDNLTDYTVTVSSQPTDPSQTCSVVANGQGTVTGPNVTDIQVSCVINTFTIGGTLSGLVSSITLQNNDGDNLDLGANGDFTFAAALDDHSSYTVTVFDQPDGQFCTVNNDSGTLAGENVDDVAVGCVDIELSLSLGQIQFANQFPDGVEEQTLTLTNTGQADLVIEAFMAPDAPFGFDPQDCAPLPRTLIPDESCTVVVSFTSPTTGEFTDELGIVSNAGSSPDSVGLTGITIPPPLPVPGLGLPALLLLLLGMLWLGKRQARLASARLPTA